MYFNAEQGQLYVYLYLGVGEEDTTWCKPSDGLISLQEVHADVTCIRSSINTSRSEIFGAMKNHRGFLAYDIV
jgi:hypothetical protein